MPRKLGVGSDQEMVAQIWARGLIQREMADRKLTYADLTAALNAIGVDDNERNVRNKVARGTFSAAFFLNCLQGMRCQTLNLDIVTALEGRSGGSGRVGF